MNAAPAPLPLVVHFLRAFPAQEHEVRLHAEQPARYAYNRAINPAKGSPLRLIDCAVVVADTITSGLLPSLLAARFRLSVKTIVRSRKKLKSLGETQLSWFADRPSRHTKRKRMTGETQHSKPKSSNSKVSASPRVVDVGARADTIMRALRLPEMCRSAVKEAVVRMTTNGMAERSTPSRHLLVTHDDHTDQQRKEETHADRERPIERSRCLTD